MTEPLDDAQLGPCIICGDTGYNLSCGGPTICPKCDCGHFDAATVEKQARVIADLRKQIAGLQRCDAESAKVERDRIVELCATVAEGFDAACNSSRMKLFVEAGLVTAIYKRDGEIGAAIRELKSCPVPALVPPPSEAGREDYYAWDWQGLLWDALGDQTKVDRVLALARERGMFDPIRLAALSTDPGTVAVASAEGKAHG